MSSSRQPGSLGANERPVLHRPRHFRGQFQADLSPVLSPDISRAVARETRQDGCAAASAPVIRAGAHPARELSARSQPPAQTRG
ncbi:hypothetical protein SKAU_G00401890 [Synaphobranchus kaupii]|uniref:Uncharacterized protein n=1 Tax=Synaphobranchus kaupii TaxID=118154 RepID=A0A9Q1E993_SYNKA|nr:hypothetical protein SKAU_G00401890 [Synaphobranchus kaupii]